MFIIDLMSRVPVYEQIIRQTESHILMGILKPGDKMPSVRSLSIHLSVNPNTIQKAYTQLDMRKIIHTVPGKGSFVSDDAITVIEKSSRKQLDDLTNVVHNLAIAGVRKEEIMEVIDQVFASVHESGTR